MTKRILSIIPARGGSKGLPRKNIIDLAGKPLIAWTIEASISSKYITKTIVSSDDDEILEVSKKYGSEIVRRPDNLASDTATSESVVEHVIDYLKYKGEEFDIVVSNLKMIRLTMESGVKLSATGVKSTKDKLGQVIDKCLKR